MRRMIFWMALCGMVASAPAYVVTFEDLTLGTSYNVGDMFTSGSLGGMDAVGGEFFWSGGGSTLGGTATVQNAGNAAGAGNEIWFNNINLNFTYAITPLAGVSLMYGDFGGDVNLSVNGDLRNVEDFSSLNGQVVGGATVFVSEYNLNGGLFGSVFAIGSISSFGIGGQELAVDNIIASIPEPGTLAILSLGSLFLAKRRR